MPLTIVIFGATGDLTARKLIPSLYRLHRKGRLPPELHILGVARSELSDDAFREKLASDLRELAAKDWDAAAWDEFAQRLFYVARDATKADGLKQVEAWLRERDRSWAGGSAPRKCGWSMPVAVA